MDEHQLILRVLGLLRRARKRLENGKKVPMAFFEPAMAFCSGFADHFHHFKEEFLLFGLLSHKRQGELDSAMGALRYQHECCRQSIAGIRQALDGYGENEALAPSFLLENLAVYVSLLQRHIHEEDRVFFPLAEKVLEPFEKEGLIRQFEEEEDRQGGRKAVFEKYEALAEDLCRIFPPG
jgi:hemerythrin-like domain-containing protein